MYAKCFIACGRMATLATVSKIGHFLDNNATSHIKCNVLIGICTYNIHFINDTIAISNHYLIMSTGKSVSEALILESVHNMTTIFKCQNKNKKQFLYTTYSELVLSSY